MTQATQSKAKLLRPREVADLLGVSERTLHQWRKDKFGPPAVMLRRHIRYDAAAVQDWLAERETGGTGRRHRARLAR